MAPSHSTALSASRQRNLLARAKPPNLLDIGMEIDNNRAYWDNTCLIQGKHTVRVPFVSKYRQYANFPIIRVHVNGKATYALVDTGASSSVTEYRLAHRARVTPLITPYAARDDDPARDPTLLSVDIMTPGGVSEMFLGVADALHIADITVSNVPFGILNDMRGLGQVSWIDGYRVETILGQDVLSAFSYVTFDYPREQMTFSTERRYIPENRKLVAAVPLLDTSTALSTIAGIDRGQPFQVVFDTGGAFGLWISSRMARQLRLSPQRMTGGIEHGGSLAGTTTTRAVGNHTITLGHTEIPGVPTRISEMDHTGRDPALALIGNELLRRFRVTIDYTRRTLYLENP
ncbi:MAG: hypothetical protein EOM20_12790 [Spartobacteria bacterium]|nr:hypothetical protein [Spartobacteria bacterium]